MNITILMDENNELRNQKTIAEQNLKNAQREQATKDNLIKKLQENLEDERYHMGQHTLRLLTAYHELSSLLSLIKQAEQEAERSLESIISGNFSTNEREELENLRMVNAQKAMKNVCKHFAEILSKSSKIDSPSFSISMFLGIPGTNTATIKFCSDSSGIVGDNDEALLTESARYPVSENSDFQAICNRVRKGEEEIHYFENNLPNLETYVDSNHYLLNHTTDKTYAYNKGDRWLLRYKALISTAIYPIHNRSDDVKKISGYLTVSSDRVNTFTKSDTLIMNLVASQLNDICSLLK